MTGDGKIQRDQGNFNRRLIQLLEQLQVSYAIGGSVAAMIYSEPRSTIDIDLMMQADLPIIELVVNAIEKWEVYVDPLETIIEFNLPSQLPINVMDGTIGVKADIYIARSVGFDQSAMSRKQRKQLYRNPDFDAWFLSPEDVILYKLDYFRQSEGVSQKHPIDIAKMLGVIGDQLDFDYLDHWARELSVLDLWHALLQEFRK